MSLNNTYFETKGRNISVPIPDTPGYTPPSPPTPPSPDPGSVPSIDRPTFTGNVEYILYNSPCEKRMINKEPLLQELQRGSITIKDDCSLTDPVIYINTSADIRNINYMKLGSFFYFARVEMMPGGNMYRVIGRRDPLTSFKDEILMLDAIVDKNEYEINPYLNDGSYIVEERQKTEVLNFPLGFEETGRYILITAGGA